MCFSRETRGKHPFSPFPGGSGILALLGREELHGVQDFFELEQPLGEGLLVCAQFRQHHILPVPEEADPVLVHLLHEGVVDDAAGVPIVGAPGGAVEDRGEARVHQVVEEGEAQHFVGAVEELRRRAGDAFEMNAFGGFSRLADAAEDDILGNEVF